MKQLSFRLQISFLSSALAGTALIVFGTISWWQIYRANIDRLDAQIINIDAQIINILMRSQFPTQTMLSETLKQKYQVKESGDFRDCHFNPFN